MIAGDLKFEDNESEFDVLAAIEFDEIDAADAIDIQLLAARVQAARHCGA